MATTAPHSSAKDAQLLDPYDVEQLQNLPTEQLNQLTESLDHVLTERHKRLIAEAERIKPKRARGPNRPKADAVTAETEARAATRKAGEAMISDLRPPVDGVAADED